MSEKTYEQKKALLMGWMKAALYLACCRCENKLFFTNIHVEQAGFEALQKGWGYTKACVPICPACREAMKGGEDAR